VIIRVTAWGFAFNAYLLDAVDAIEAVLRDASGGVLKNSLA
jgi:hypothetical protein